jgi:Protein of unknown function (DUF3147)
MTPTLDLRRLRDKRPGEFAVRFAFGGAVTVATQLIARAFGPEIAGLFLAFPAILPASLTLVREHDGPLEASRDALGAMAGSVAQIPFAALAWWGFGTLLPALVLTSASVAWFVTGALLWWLFLSGVEGGRR